MPFPRISPRRWFWILLLAAGFWMTLGASIERKQIEKKELPPGGVPFMKWAQTAFWKPFGTLIVPLEWVPSQAQLFISGVMARAEAHDTGESPEQLRARILTLENENSYLTGQAERLQNELNSQRAVKTTFGITSQDILSANITGHQVGLSSSLITLDKGTRDGVQPGMVVLSMISPLGRVESVGYLTSTVRLLTDPSKLKTRAKIVRRTTGSSAFEIVPSCLINGLGDGELQSLTVSETAIAIPPVKGDLVLLSDSNWSPRVQSTVIGEVIEVGRKDDQPGRYDIRITPRVNVNGIGTVMVLLKKD